MWAHYAANHTGIILGVDTTHPFFNQTLPPEATSLSQIDASLLGRVFPVTYERIRPELRQVTTPGPIGFEEFLQKSDEWIYEKEYRMFMPLTFANTSFVIDSQIISLFEIPEAAITRVILGFRSEISKILMDFSIAIDINPKLSHIKLEVGELHKDLYHIAHFPITP